MRRQGKSVAHKLALEAALDAGQRVLVCTPSSTTLQYRRKHLTVIQDVPRRESKPLIIYNGPWL